MATQNQGNQGVVLRSLAYDDPAYLTRVTAPGVTVASGGSALSAKFYAWTQLQVYGFTAVVTAVGTSTYTANGTGTTSAQTYSPVVILNTNTTGTAITLNTSTTGTFIVGGTASPGTNVNVQGLGGYIQGAQTYAFNTLGGTNTTQIWGTATYSYGYPGGGAGGGQGGFPMNPGDSIYFVSGTDATATATIYMQYSVSPPGGLIIA
jgi:hypothetical protein